MATEEEYDEKTEESVDEESHDVREMGPNEEEKEEQEEEEEIETTEAGEEQEEEVEEQEEEEELPIVLTPKNYMPLESLLPDRMDWARTKRRYKRHRLQFLMLILVTYLTLWFLNIPIYIIKNRRLLAAAEMYKSMLMRIEVGRPLPKSCVVLDCVTTCPETSTIPNWYTLYELPYAALPRKRAYFSEAINPYSPGECYLAYWRSVSKKKRQFTNGKLIFHGHQIFDNNFECAQMKVKDGVEIPVGNPHSCLTLSFHYPYGKNTTKLPIVVYIGGDYMLQHRPQLISAKMASELGIIYIIINYRLGVFGFSDFNTMDSKSNNAIRDIKKALIWIHQNIHHFNGDSSRVTIYGENAGATIAVVLLQIQNSGDIIIANRRIRLFSQVWLADGSVYIPKVKEENNPFKELILHDVNLNIYCDKWKASNTKKQTFNNPLRLKLHCLRDVPVDVWLRKTPIEWLRSRQIDQNILPEPDEEKISIIKNDGELVSNPIGSLYRDKLESTSNSIRDMPLVIYSSVSHECTKSCETNQSHSWSFEKLHSTVIEEMDNFQSRNRQAPTGNAIWNFYRSYVEQTIDELEYAKKLSKFSYKAIYDEIRRDLRGNCLYSMYAKYLLDSRQSKNYPVYRLLNRVPRLIYVDGSGNRCDIPFYLIDSKFSCGNGTHPLYEAVHEMEMKATLEIFHDFVQNGKIERAIRMEITDESSTNIAYNIVDDLDLTSATGREIAMFQLCKAWFSEDSGQLFAARHSRFN